MRVSDYLAEKAAEAGIRDVFLVVGGGAMYLDDAFGHSKKLHCTYHHNEQAAAMAAESYAREDNTPACVIVTTGPGATNALTGCLCAYMESIPVFILSGQARYATTVRGMGLSLRSTGIQEFDVTKSAAPMTKYAVMVEKKEDVRYAVERALYLMNSGRRGPVWVDVPLDVQSAEIDPACLRGYDPAEDRQERIPAVREGAVRQTIEKLRTAKRPVLFGGAGVRAAGGAKAFRELSMLLGIPVLTGMSSVDLVPESWPYYAGRTGMTGQRAGNLTMAGSDVFLSIGSRLSFLQTGFNYKEWARGAYVIANEIDPEELKKPNVHVELPVICDAAAFMNALIQALRAEGADEAHPFRTEEAAAWCARSLARRKAYPPVTEKMRGPQADGAGNIYAFYDALSEQIPEGEPLVVSVGTSRVAAIQAFRVKDGARFFTNTATASMGYGLPAAIGMAVRLRAGGTAVNMVNGEGCFMMNLQEMQTIATNRLPVRVFLLCNGGYHSIRQTERAYFGDEKLIGIGPESGDLGFPEAAKVAETFGFSYGACLRNETLDEDLAAAMALPLPALIEVQASPLQSTEPKASSRRLPDGSYATVPLEDMAPFLDRAELERELEIPMTEGERRQ